MSKLRVCVIGMGAIGNIHAQMYKEDMDRSISVFASILEPLLLFVMGLFVALIVWAVDVPYFKLPGVL